MRPLVWLSLAGVLVSGSLEAAETVSPPPKAPERATSGKPRIVPDVFLGLHYHAAVTVWTVPYVLATPAGPLDVATCTIAVEDGEARLLWRRAFIGTLIDGVGRMKWKAEVYPTGAMSAWQERLGGLIRPDMSCDGAIVTLRASLSWKKPRRVKQDVDLSAVERADLTERVVGYEGPNADSLVVASHGRHGYLHWEVVSTKERR